MDSLTILDLAVESDLGTVSHPPLMTRTVCPKQPQCGARADRKGKKTEYQFEIVYERGLKLRPDSTPRPTELANDWLSQEYDVNPDPIYPPAAFQGIKSEVKVFKGIHKGSRVSVAIKAISTRSVVQSEITAERTVLEKYRHPSIVNLEAFHQSLTTGFTCKLLSKLTVHC